MYNSKTTTDRHDTPSQSASFIFETTNARLNGSMVTIGKLAKKERVIISNISEYIDSRCGREV